ncbi:FAD/NAD(P)-binding protein [Asanoa sp. WMMD1127]|uniref:FAD/NAD(P)-binding protein n=1 Tax=Asanoa sp. WMMD1127 TaxID=3016107 RepID=UPI0024170755|nr:FAD/NAD(P)-binding protein [Asanoa sp. WMMD1127]MDG4827288.1 FAD/NAD(P)-binding protein [Asanoa sp. WMMD1127]
MEPVIVIGGGPAGALAAIAVSRHSGRPVVVVDPAAALGPGSAYATREPSHLLNSRAGSMSVDPCAPGDFAAWARCSGDSFQPRGGYGDYLAQRLGAVPHIARRALRVRPAGAGRWAVELSDGTTRRASDVVLALGPPPPVFPAAAAVGVRRAPGYVPLPWTPGALDRIAAPDRVLLLGTGLTAVDAVLTLLARGHTGRIVAVSRHGLLPRAHTDQAAPVALSADLPPGLRALLRELRRSTDWRATVDALRPRVDEVWAGLTDEERRRFLRHLARWWEVHRHRCAPPVAATIAAARSSGALVVAAGRVTDIRTVPRGFEVTVGDSGPWPFDAVVNCTGPGHPAGLSLVRTLVADGLARADPLGLGIDVDAAGHPTGRDGSPVEGLHVLGSLRRGRWWETTAIPEIRTQAYAVAARLADPPATHAA